MSSTMVGYGGPIGAPSNPTRGALHSMGMIMFDYRK